MAHHTFRKRSRTGYRYEMTTEQVDARPVLASALVTAVDHVGSFVHDNRGQLVHTLRGLTEVSRVVARQQDYLAQTLHVAPTALADLIESYHQRQNAVGVDLHGANVHSPGQLVCGAIGGAQGASAARANDLCQKAVGDLLDQLAGSQAGQLVEWLTTSLGVL